MEEKKLVLHLGSNQGDRIFNIQSAESAISESFGPIRSKSKYYETEAWGLENQAPFINSALIVATDNKPLDVMRALKSIEMLIGRKNSPKWNPRIIDIDIIFYGDYSFFSKCLNIPHKDMENRRFVLKPLSDIIPELIHPIHHMSINDLLLHCSDPLKVKELNI